MHQCRPLFPPHSPLAASRAEADNGEGCDSLENAARSRAMAMGKGSRPTDLVFGNAPDFPKMVEFEASE